MGGRIAVKQHPPGHGSTFEFRVTLPLRPCAGGAVDPHRGAACLAEPQLQDRRILVVEDNPTNRGILAATRSRNWGAECNSTAVDQGFSALDALETAVGDGLPEFRCRADRHENARHERGRAGRAQSIARRGWPATRLAMLTSLFQAARPVARARRRHRVVPRKAGAPGGIAARATQAAGPASLRCPATCRAAAGGRPALRPGGHVLGGRGQSGEPRNRRHHAGAARLQPRDRGERP